MVLLVGVAVARLRVLGLIVLVGDGIVTRVHLHFFFILLPNPLNSITHPIILHIFRILVLFRLILQAEADQITSDDALCLPLLVVELVAAVDEVGVRFQGQELSSLLCASLLLYI